MSELEAEKIYPGIGRLAYVGLALACFPIIGGIAWALRSSGFDSRPFNLLVMIVILAAWFGLPAYRLKNCGYPSWYALGMVVPLVNIWVYTICLAAPAGYADTKKLDLPGKIIAGVAVGLLVLALIGALLDGLT